MKWNEKQPIRYLITGGCGFIGSNFIRHLRKKAPQSQIRVLDNLSVGSTDDLANVCQFEQNVISNDNRSIQDFKEKVQLVVGDIRNYETCVISAQGVDVIIHLAANTGVAPSVENPRTDMETNVIGVFNMLEAARKVNVRRFVFASSGAPIGEVEPPIHEELAPHPVSPYGASKLAGEGYCSAFYRTYGLETVSLRFGNVYGPGSEHKSSVVAEFIRNALTGESLEIYGDGKQTRDFIFIDDLIEAIMLSCVSPEIGGETFQIASNRETTITELVDLLLHLLKRFGLSNINVVTADPRQGDVKRNFSDTNKAKKRLGWTPIFDLEKGLKRTISWFLNRQ